MMDYRILRDDLERLVGLTREDEELLITYLHDKKLKKRQFLVEEGEASPGLFFVLSGLLRVYSIDKNGYEHILRFSPKGHWVADITTILYNKPGNLFIDAIDPSDILILLKTDFDEIFHRIPLLERYFRIICQMVISDYQQRLVDDLSLSALERYNNFCNRYPDLIGCIPQKYIASYIGVTPEFLSKILSTPQRKIQSGHN